MDSHNQDHLDPLSNGGGGFAGSKRTRQELESFSTVIGSKSKPCTKFFSTSGCPFGEGCHFLHYVLGGLSAVTQMTNLGNPSSRNSVGVSGLFDHGVKARMCNKVNTEEGCRFGDKCRFAHSERELGRSSVHGPESYSPMGGRLSTGGGRFDHSPAGLGAAASFGASATAKISVDASLAGAIIGKGGINTKNICRVTGARLSIRDHESDPNLKNIELEGTFDQIKDASSMVRELIIKVAPSHSTADLPRYSTGGATASPANNFKTKLCENFAKGSCTFGDRCHFAHGASELRTA